MNNLKEMGVNLITFGLIEIIKPCFEASKDLEWTVDINYNFVLEQGISECAMYYELSEPAVYSLYLSQSFTKDQENEYKVNLLNCEYNAYKNAEEIPQAVVDYFEADFLFGRAGYLLDKADKYKFTDKIEAFLAIIFSPGDIAVYDSQGRVTGLVNGEIKEEIPNSIYDKKIKAVIILSPTDSYRYMVAGTDKGTYGLVIASLEDGEAAAFTATDIPTTVGAIHQYTIDWNALSQGEKGVTVKIDSDGNDVVERTIITNNSFYPLIALFTFSPENPLIGEKVILDASTSFDLGGGVIKKYCWEFYNAANQDPFYVIEGHDKKIISYSFTSEGIYLVRLTVTDDEGEYSYTESSITIKEPIKEPVFYVPDDYSTIQAAVDAASAGDTIIVRDGTYTENVAVNKRLTIQSENGYKNCIVKAAKSNEHVFTVTADYENISGFTVKGTLTEWDYTSYGGYAGIYLDHVNYCNISNNNALNNHYGIHLRDSSHICITNNNVQSNKNDDIFLSTSSNNIIDNNKASLITLWWCSNNNVLTNNNATISLYSASNNILTNNKGSEINLRSYSNNNIANNNIIGAGISLDSCSSNSILTNTLGDKGISIYGRNLSHFNTHIIKDNVINGKPIYYYKNNKGIKVTETGGQIILANCSNIIVENISNGRIDLAYTNDSKISNNNVSKIEVRYSSNDTIANNNVSNGDGINIEYSSNNKIISNNVSNNSYGIFIGISSNNIIVNNIVNSNINDGITLDGSPDNVIYFNNFVGNGRNVCAYGLNNIWNSPAPITYTYNGNTYTNYLGNYWDDYTDVDTDNDGIWDNPYSINWDSTYGINSDQDHYPLMTVSGRYFNPSPTIPTPPTSTLTPTPRPTLTPSPTLTPTPRPTLRPTATLFEKIEGLTTAIRVGFGI